MVLGLVGSVIAGVTVRAVVSGDLGMFAGELGELAISSEAPRDDRAPARGAREEGGRWRSARYAESGPRMAMTRATSTGGSRGDHVQDRQHDRRRHIHPGLSRRTTIREDHRRRGTLSVLRGGPRKTRRPRGAPRS